MRLAIIGSGIAGLVCAYLLHRQHELVLYESNDRIGGHTHTVEVPGGPWVDTGFIVFNRENYPHFTRLLHELGVTYRHTSMSFSAHCEQTGLEYSTASINHLFAQRRNLLRTSFCSLLRGILRFNKQVAEGVEGITDDLTVEQFLLQHRYPESFVKYFLYPISTALWSCPRSKIESFPMRFIMEFYRHHGMHQLLDQPIWHVIEGGSHRYVEKLSAQFRTSIRVNSPVDHVIRETERVVIHAQGRQESFDEVIFACHSDQALRLLGDGVRPSEREVLGAFPYSSNDVTLHTDTSILPTNRRAWAAWNSRIEKTPSTSSKVSYNMNILQSLQSEKTFCVSLNQDDNINDSSVVKRMVYEHPLF
ncbi:MAG TPA: FAD-dependent oxidoreductase, partial [Gemmatales bacterium]|nr:FAD-dependent oxidoreductase [Gemmatales bacterium]